MIITSPLEKKELNNNQRIDNWLYRLRFAKTRGVAQKIIKDGKVRINKIKIKKTSNKIKYRDIIIFNAP